MSARTNEISLSNLSTVPIAKTSLWLVIHLHTSHTTVHCIACIYIYRLSIYVYYTVNTCKYIEYTMSSWWKLIPFNFNEALPISTGCMSTYCHVTVYHEGSVQIWQTRNTTRAATQSRALLCLSFLKPPFYTGHQLQGHQISQAMFGSPSSPGCRGILWDAVVRMAIALWRRSRTSLQALHTFHHLQWHSMAYHKAPLFP